MGILLKFSPSARPLISLATAAIINNSNPAAKIEIIPNTTTTTVEATIADKTVTGCDSDVSIALATHFKTVGLVPECQDDLKKWMTFGTVDLFITNQGKKIYYINTANNHLTLRTFFSGHNMTVVDIAVFFGIGHALSWAAPDSTRFPHLARWFNYMASRSPIATTLAEASLIAGETGATQKKMPTSDIKEQKNEETELEAFEGMEMGKVVTRFPPEPSGYLHIGHCKAAMINHYYAQRFNGKMLLRFDDTNPSKEKEEYQEAIREDLMLLGISTVNWSYTSDWFPQLQAEMERWLVNGWAYVDDTDWDVMREERGKGVESKCRNLPVEENIRRWKEMLVGSEYGASCCVRAKIDMQHKVGCMRDPAMYRCVLDPPHHRTGTTYKAYPLYDFACPLVDSWEGVTHAMRSSEYTDRKGLYDFVLETSGVRTVNMCVFSRLNFVNTVLSKRKLTWCIDTGKVNGWDDARLPTLRGVFRRGLTKEGIMAFLVELGAVSKNLNLMEWDKLWAKNKQFIDPISGRYSAVNTDGAVKITISNVAAVEEKTRALHPQNPAMGEVPLVLTKEVLIESDDAKDLETNEEITLLQWGNIIIKSIKKENDVVVGVDAEFNPEGSVKKTKKKLHWVSADNSRTVPVILREFDHLITKKKPEDDDDISTIVNEHSVFDSDAIAEVLVKDLNCGSIIQFNRRGYFIIDKDVVNGKAVLIKIPDGKTKSMSTVSTKVDPALLAKGGKTGAQQ